MEYLFVGVECSWLSSYVEQKNIDCFVSRVLICLDILTQNIQRNKKHLQKRGRDVKGQLDFASLYRKQLKLFQMRMIQTYLFSTKSFNISEMTLHFSISIFLFSFFTIMSNEYNFKRYT